MFALARSERGRRDECAASPIAAEHLQRSVRWHAKARRPCKEVVKRLPTDAARRYVDDAGEAHLVVGVLQEAEVADEVLDLAALVEAHASHDLVGHAVAEARLFERARLCVDAVGHDDVAQIVGFVARQPLHGIERYLRLLFLRVRLGHHNGCALVVVGEEVLLQARAVLGDDVLRRPQDGLGGAVVLRKVHDLGPRVVLTERQDVANVRVAPRVDRLVGVSDNAEVLVLGGKHPRQLVLRDVRVLKLIHHQVDVALLVL